MNKRGVAAVSLLFAALGAHEVGAQTDPKENGPAIAEPKKAAQVATDPKKPTRLQSTRGFAEHTGLARAGKVIGMTVKDPAGRDVGNIEDLLLDSRGEIAYGVLSFGGFLGIGNKLFAVPWDSMVVDQDDKTVLLDVSKETLERAPSFAKDKWPETYDRAWDTDVRKAWRDAFITAAVKSQLVADKVSSLVKVNVDTNQGIVELSGRVDSERTKQRAEELARKVEGVRQVVNNLKTS